MLLAKQNDVLTRERLTASPWAWGHLHEPPMATNFQFAPTGNITGYQNTNEHSWTLESGELRIFNANGELTWLFEIMFQSQNILTLIAQYQNDPYWRPFFHLTEQPNAQATPQPTTEPVRLVIWDLDDTLWKGTLSETEITPIATNLALIRTLTERGIVNSICSKNNPIPTQTILTNLGIWDEFIFPEINFAPKGPMLQNIIENTQLRPETILFIDDNETNLAEARFFFPTLQTTSPAIIPQILTDSRFKGKPDPNKTRLAHYKILEHKNTERKAAAGNNELFLHNANIKLSFHTDIESQFPRIHDLVNRTNQLNFTKNRWPENPTEALKTFQTEQNQDFKSHGGYIKVSDRYGNYGICGFYFIINNAAQHFLFSCRTMNMGVESFTHARLGHPTLPYPAPPNIPVTWITIVPDTDIEQPFENTRKRPTICIRGACDMLMTSNFLRLQTDTVEETTYAWNGWEIASLPRIIAAHEEANRPENQTLLTQLPGMPANRFASAIITGTADAYVLSFSQETFHGLYRAKSTGLIIPMGHFEIGMYAREKPDYTKMTYAEVSHLPGITEAEWDFFTTEFEFLGGFNQSLFIADIEIVFAHLRRHQKPVIIIGLNESVGTDSYILEFFANINRIVKPLTQQSGFTYIDFADHVRTEADLAPEAHKGGAHFARHAYASLADSILKNFSQSGLGYKTTD